MRSINDLVAAIDEIDGDDPEAAHGTLDDLLLEQQPEPVQMAVQRLLNRTRYWTCA